MINLRYHIVSITAVFLALGIGLTLGSSFLDRVTVDNLKNQLETVQRRVEKTERDNSELTGQVGSLQQRDDAFADELRERLLGGHLTGVPVLVIAARGTDDALIDSASNALSAAGAQVAGTWWLTDAWLLDDPSKVSALAEVLGISSADAGRLRRNAAIQLSALLIEASKAPEPPVDAAAGPPPAPTSSEPDLVARLKDAGFLQYRAPAGAPDSRVLLPAASTRYLAVSGALPSSGAQLISAALLDALVADGVAPVVAAQGVVTLPKAEPPASEDDQRTTFVGPLREGKVTRDRLSTIDDLDTAAGLAALVLAVEDLGIPLVGHYGSASSASRLLPASGSG